MTVGMVSIRKAKQHNLDSIDLDLPRNKLIVITGVSGSGKSSLAFDTIYAEGQRRYVESLSPYARQFLDLCTKPDVESITGLSPAISVNQKTTSKKARSTVSTATEIHDYLRLMYARIGIPHSPTTGKPIVRQSASQIIDSISALPVGTKIYIMGPVIRGRKGEHRKDILELKRHGYSRVKVDGQVYDINEVPPLEKTKKHDIWVVVDRISIAEHRQDRLCNSVENALHIGKGVVYVEIVALSDSYEGEYSVNQILVFSENFVCHESGFTIEQMEPRLFSFNTVYGSCKYCAGIGKSYTMSVDLVIPDKDLSILRGAIAPIGAIPSHGSFYDSKPHTVRQCVDKIVALSKCCGFDLSVPWRMLDPEVKELLLWGNKDSTAERAGSIPEFDGILNAFNDQNDLATTKIVEKYSTIGTCKHCNGFRLCPEALSVKVISMHIGEVSALSVGDALSWCKSLPTKLTAQDQVISSKIVEEIIRRLEFLQNVGLGYLTLDRESTTLSGGESQRIRLASQIGSGLMGVLYVLDEPSVGLHQRDNVLLINTLKSLRDMGNTVIVVEHDDETMVNADYIVDIGPGAGSGGGKVVAQGTLQDITENLDSLTGQYLSGARSIAVPQKNKVFQQWIEIEGASANNLRDLYVKIPIGGFTCITGVSGSGKSSLITDTLYGYAMYKLHGSHHSYGKCKAILGLENIDKVIEIDQSPIGRTPLSNPATYVGLFTHIRSWFAGLPLAKARGYTISRFSFNTKGGRCEICRGDGCIKVEMHFLPDMYVQCSECNGLRYNRETLEVTYKGKSIADVLNMTVDQALEFFETIPLIKEKLDALHDVGMGYIKIGQSSTTLSGGEAQRIKLSRELSKRSTGKTLYILDEPTTGLHFADIDNLLRVLHQLSDLGNTVVVIEHNLHVIKTADYIVDIGPEGGDRGGTIVATGSPREVIEKFPHSITAQYLANYLPS